MNVLYATYNIHHNSIDVYTHAGYCLRIDCNKAEEGLKARLYLEGNMQMWVDSEDSLELW